VRADLAVKDCVEVPDESVGSYSSHVLAALL